MANILGRNRGFGISTLMMQAAFANMHTRDDFEKALRRLGSHVNSESEIESPEGSALEARQRDIQKGIAQAFENIIMGTKSEDDLVAKFDPNNTQKVDQVIPIERAFPSLNESDYDKYGNYIGPNKPDKGEKNGSCNITRCQRPGATFYNKGMSRWYCPSCAREINWPGGRAQTMELYGVPLLCEDDSSPTQFAGFVHRRG
jgi:hypothetical protein